MLALVAAGAGVGVVLANRDRGGASASSGCSGEAALRISAAPALAAVLEDYADDFDTWVEDRTGVPCTSTQVTGASPQEFATAVGRRPRRGHDGRPHDVDAGLLPLAFGPGP